MGAVKEDESLSRVHPGDGSIKVGRVTHDVGDGAVERLVVLTLLVVLVSVLVEESVRMVVTCVLKAEVIGALGKTEHVLSVDSEIHSDSVSVDTAHSGVGDISTVLLGVGGSGVLGGAVVSWSSMLGDLVMDGGTDNVMVSGWGS